MLWRQQMVAYTHFLWRLVAFLCVSCASLVCHVNQSCVSVVRQQFTCWLQLRGGHFGNLTADTETNNNSSAVVLMLIFSQIRPHGGGGGERPLKTSFKTENNFFLEINLNNKQNAPRRWSDLNYFLLFMQISSVCLQEVTSDSFRSPGKRLSPKIGALNLCGFTF